MVSRVIVRCEPRRGPAESIVVPLRDGDVVYELLRAVRARATNTDGLEALYLEDGAGRVYPGHRLLSTDSCGRVAESVVVSGDYLVAARRPERGRMVALARSRSRSPAIFPAISG